MSEYQAIKEEMCEIGRRMYARHFVAANEGNLSVRVDEDRVLCTPTFFCKGVMSPDDISTVNMQGEQLAGKRKRTSEVLLHLEIMKERPEIRGVVHGHPPHATAFAVAREPIPTGVHPEADVFLGEVPIADYATPGDDRLARTILPFVHKCNTIVLANHGTVSFDVSLEQAYWWTEILDAYCRMLILARQVGRVQRLSDAECRDLIELKQRFGLSDPRAGEEFADADLTTSPLFRDTWAQSRADARAFGRTDIEDGLVDKIAKRVVELMKQ
ncbi:Methylthioribulose-1-phosphate dehydratase [Posidoniimonas polymericola]|uniref:Methylthioribulose-1-phosphate dehydratase n=1 Tax=Posidoniimonas polymericola TaxID=2528002 RepID=A0A5C5YPL4_9BACT|nr:class II aldolase/adducin family protein [Posidoniimonas polymericola]TWT76902.1 Methylthioribulose-1-phosphate dehydratase [Posidoniimonas polymericola]